MIVAADVGGTKLSAAAVDTATWRPVAPPLTVGTPARSGGPAVLEALVDLVDLVGRAGAGLDRVALGVGTAGVIDPARGEVVSATDTLPGWAGTPLLDHLRRVTDLPVAVLNDVQAHALGEAVHGAGCGARSVLVLAVGTGVGACLVLEGRVVAGHGGVGGHGGHVASPEAGDLACTCGARGHLEAIASGPAIAAAHVRAGGEPLDARAVCARAADGDPRATEVVRAAGLALGRALGGWLNLLDPERVVVSGGVAAAGEVWWDALREGAAAETLPPLSGRPIVPAVLGETAALVGAAAHAHRCAS